MRSDIYKWIYIQIIHWVTQSWIWCMDTEMYILKDFIPKYPLPLITSYFMTTALSPGEKMTKKHLTCLHVSSFHEQIWGKCFQLIARCLWTWNQSLVSETLTWLCTFRYCQTPVENMTTHSLYETPEHTAGTM